MVSASGWMAAGTRDRPATRSRSTARPEPRRSRRRRARAIGRSRGRLHRRHDPIDLLRELWAVDELEESLRRRLERLRAHALVDGFVRLGVVAGGATSAPRRKPRARVILRCGDPYVRHRDPTASRHRDRPRAVPGDEVRRVDHYSMTFAEEIIHKRRGGGEYRAVLLVRVGRRDEETAPELVARHVGRTEPRAEESRAMRLADTGKAHHHDEHGPSVRRRGYGRDLSAELRREDLGARRVRVRLRGRRGAGRPADLGHVPNPSSLRASRAAVASSYGRFSSPTMIDSSCPLPARRTVSSAVARPMASLTAAWRSSITR